MTHCIQLYGFTQVRCGRLEHIVGRTDASVIDKYGGFAQSLAHFVGSGGHCIRIGEVTLDPDDSALLSIYTDRIRY